MIRNNPQLWEKVKSEMKASSKGGEPGTWSGRKAQLSVLEYKKRGGTYSGKKPTDGLTAWTKQNWRTKSGKPSSETGERYLPEKAIKALSDKDYKRTSDIKRRGMRAGIQFVPQPADIIKKTREYY